MKKIYKLIAFSFILALPLMMPEMATAQSKAQVENVDFFLAGENLIITYDIAKAKSGETFDVSVNISTASGQKLNAFALSGDIGPGVYAGKYKKITWDLAKDNVYIDDQIMVEVFARSMMPAKSVSVGGALLRSLVFPGWGNSYAKGGGAYWLMGIAAWGAAGGAVYFNNEAYNAYEDYKNATEKDARDQLFADAEDHHQMQQNLMIAAAAIWAVDLIWTGIQAGNVNRKSRSKMAMGYYYDPVVKQPMVTFTYKLN